jgi:hypothetical protein
MPSNAARSSTRGRPVRPFTAGGHGRINGSTSRHNLSLTGRRGGEEDRLGTAPHDHGSRPRNRGTGSVERLRQSGGTTATRRRRP